MYRKWRRREVLSSGAVGILGFVAGCSSDSRDPDFNGVRVGNSTDSEITARITVSDDQSEVEFQETFDLQPHADVRRNTDLHETKYTVSTVLHPDDETNNKEYEHEWQWQGCYEDYITVQISDSGVDVGNECIDD